MLVVRALLFTALFREARLFQRHRRCIIRAFITSLNSAERIPTYATHLYKMTDQKLFPRLYLAGGKSNALRIEQPNAVAEIPLEHPRSVL